MIEILTDKLSILRARIFFRKTLCDVVGITRQTYSVMQIKDTDHYNRSLGDHADEERRCRPYHKK